MRFSPGVDPITLPNFPSMSTQDPELGCKPVVQFYENFICNRAGHKRVRRTSIWKWYKINGAVKGRMTTAGAVHHIRKVHDGQNQ